MSLNTDIVDLNAELLFDGVSVGSPVRGSSNRLEWLGVTVPHPGGAQTVPLEMRIRNLVVDAGVAGEKGPNVTAFVSLRPVGVVNNVMNVANITNRCNYEVAPGSLAFGSQGGEGSVAVTVAPFCPWQAVASASWISISSSSGNASGEIQFEVEKNAQPAAREGSITVQGQSAVIRQAAAAMLPDLTITSFQGPTQGAVGGELAGASTVVRNAGQGTAQSFRLGFYYSSDDLVTTADRFSGTTCAVEILGPGSETVCSTAIAVPDSLAPGEYFLGAIADDVRKVDESEEANNVRLNDSGPVTISGPVRPPAAVTSAATFQPVAAPGLFVALFGEGWSDELVVADALPFPTELGGLSVRVGDAPAPLSFVSKNQINAVLPFDLEPGATVPIRVVRGQQESQPLAVQVKRAAPGILTTTQDGQGQAAALRADYQLADAAHPVRPGDAIQIFCIGLGPVNPSIEAGQAADPQVALYRTVAAVRVTIGGLPAQVLFSGLAPNFAGLYQVNATLPGEVFPSGASPVQILVELDGGEILESNVATIAVAAGPATP